MPRLKVLFDSNGLVHAVDKSQLFPLFSIFNEGIWTEGLSRRRTQAEIKRRAELGLAEGPQRPTSQENAARRPGRKKHMNPKLYLRLLLILKLANRAGKK